MVPGTTGDLTQLCQRPWLLVWNVRVSIGYLLTPWLSPKGLLVTRMTDPSGRTRWLSMVHEVPPGVPFRPHPARHMGFRSRSPEVPVLRPRSFSHRTLGRHITSESSICSWVKLDKRSWGTSKRHREKHCKTMNGCQFQCQLHGDQQERGTGLLRNAGAGSQSPFREPAPAGRCLAGGIMSPQPLVLNPNCGKYQGRKKADFSGSAWRPQPLAKAIQGTGKMVRCPIMGEPGPRSRGVHRKREQRVIWGFWTHHAPQKGEHQWAHFGKCSMPVESFMYFLILKIINPNWRKYGKPKKVLKKEKLLSLIPTLHVNYCCIVHVHILPI